jgi:hypothetical protein
VPLAGGGDVGVANKVDVPHGLDPHDADQLAIDLMAPELDPGRDFAIELLRRHVRLVPAIGRDDAAIGLRGGVDDPADRLALVITAAADGPHGARIRSDGPAGSHGAVQG